MATTGGGAERAGPAPAGCRHEVLIFDETGAHCEECGAVRRAGCAWGMPNDSHGSPVGGPPGKESTP